MLTSKDTNILEYLEFFDVEKKENRKMRIKVKTTDYEIEITINKCADSGSSHDDEVRPFGYPD